MMFSSSRSKAAVSRASLVRSRGMVSMLPGYISGASLSLISLNAYLRFPPLSPPERIGAPERSRTPNPQIRSLVLYPVELRAPAESGPAMHGGHKYPTALGNGKAHRHNPALAAGCYRDHIGWMGPDAIARHDSAADDPATRPSVSLLGGRHRRAEGGHPWIYSNEVRMDAEAKALAPGSLVTLRRADDSPLGVAMFNPHTLLAARLLDRDATRPIGRRFLARRIGRALKLRERLFDMPFYRLVHAEADGLPGLVIDRFGAVLVVQSNAAGMARLEPIVLDALSELLSPAAIVLRNDSPARGLEGLASEARVASGTLDGPVEVHENGAVFRADLLAGQKTGWFFDQRDSRRFIAALACGARVLDLYCYAGGFALQAARAGAAAVLGIDRSEPALALAAEAAELNGVAQTCAFRRGEAFAETAQLAAAGERFDIVIAD